MALEPWDEVRTALHVARAGTVSGAATALGVHHATVIRHIDALEDRINVKLFQRHAKGYTPTEAGKALFETAAEAEKRFDQLAARLTGLQEGISGPVIITTVPELSTALLPALIEMLTLYPDLEPCLRTEARILRLEYGEAHLAIRAGRKPQDPDNVVQSLGTLAVGLFASDTYLAAHGTPAPEDGTLRPHRFVTTSEDDPRAVHDQWLAELGGRIVLRSNDHTVRLAAIRAGLGLGFLPVAEGRAAGLTAVVSGRADWDAPLWMVTHVDLHRSPKVQSCARLLRAHLAQSAPGAQSA